jgi:hypothetical protein
MKRFSPSRRRIPARRPVDVAQPAPEIASSQALDRDIHHDLVFILTHFADYTRVLGENSFSLLIGLYGIRNRLRERATFTRREIESATGISYSTLHRRLQRLKKSGVLELKPIPGTQRSVLAFELRRLTLNGKRPAKRPVVPARPKKPARR